MWKTDDKKGTGTALGFFLGPIPPFCGAQSISKICGSTVLKEE